MNYFQPRILYSPELTAKQSKIKAFSDRQIVKTFSIFRKLQNMWNKIQEYKKVPHGIRK